MEIENEVTISTHNGSQVSRQHNLRNPGLQKHFSFAGLVVMRKKICYGQGPILRKSGLDIY